MNATKLMAVALGLSVSVSASAKGLVVDGSELNSAQRGVLLSNIEQARRADPGAFSLLQAMFAKLPKADQFKRGPWALMTPGLKAMGARGLYPMLDALAFNGQDLAGLSESAQESWRLALLDAVGLLRSPEAEPVLVGALRTEGLTERERLVASIGLGRLASDSAVQFLVSRLSMTHREAALTGLGESRRLAAVHAVANVLAGDATEPEVRSAVKALGEAGSAWAWKLARDGREAQGVRTACAEALVAAFVRFSGEARQAASNSLMRVDAGNTLELIAQAKGAHPALSTELDALADRFARNPAR